MPSQTAERKPRQRFYGLHTFYDKAKGLRVEAEQYFKSKEARLAGVTEFLKAHEAHSPCFWLIERVAKRKHGVRGRRVSDKAQAGRGR